MSEYICNTDDKCGLCELYKTAVEIVRCRDCVNYQPYRTHKHGIMNRCYDENGHTHRRDETDFCSRGERRSE